MVCSEVRRTTVDDTLAASLPRLLYVGSVAVERSTAGPALLYRLLDEYPADKLMIVETHPDISALQGRLPEVKYKPVKMPGTRLLYTRFGKTAATMFACTAGASAYQLRSIDFNPEAVVTVPHGFGWLAAAAYASKKNLPLHLIIHDDLLATVPARAATKALVRRRFGGVYRRASSRLCVSPFMEAYFREKYGVGGQVLYPSRAKTAHCAATTPRTYNRERGPLVGAFAGSICFPGYARLIRSLADCLLARGGRLLLFGPGSASQVQDLGLYGPNIVWAGMVSSEQLLARLQSEADFLFVPMHFDEDGSDLNMRISFPSKLTDYTATGLPLLIQGPGYCSAVRWAKIYEGVAEVVTSRSADAVFPALERFEEREHRIRLGRTAAQVGAQLFAHSVAIETFYTALRSGSSHRFRPTTQSEAPARGESCRSSQ